MLNLVNLHLDLHDLIGNLPVGGLHGKRQAELLARTGRHAHELVVELVAELARPHEVGHMAAGKLRERLSVNRGVEVEAHVRPPLDGHRCRVVLPGSELFRHVVEIGRHILGGHGLLLGHLHAHRVVGGKREVGAHEAVHLEHVVLPLDGRLAREMVGVEERHDGGT